MSPIQSMTVTYKPVNEEDTFTHGDTVRGEVRLEVSKECQLDRLFVKFKGKSEVLWTERHGNTTVVYHSKDKYFSFKHYFIGDPGDIDDNSQAYPQGATVQTYSPTVPPGIHLYPFTFQFPSGAFPPSFEASTGKIVYLLEARLHKSMRLPKKERVKLNFLGPTGVPIQPALLQPLDDSKDKKLKFFNSGTVSMDVHLEKSGFYEGEGIQIVALIQNNSSREIKPKFCLYSKHSFFARGKRRLHCNDLLKEVGDPIPASSGDKVTRTIMIPHDAKPSILDCSNITVEYRLRVYLDVKYASDPEIKFPIVIVQKPRDSASAPRLISSDFGAGFAHQAYGDPVPQAWGFTPPQPSVTNPALDPPPPYGAYDMYPPMRH